MKHLPTAIVTLIVGLIIAYFTFNLNDKYVDLRYTISEKIPTKFVGTSATENIQQLVVKNNGNLPAEKIQIKINGSIEEHYILKNLLNDEVILNKSKDYFEAIYPSLSPDAQFIFIFKTTGFNISNENLEIKHNKGNATGALAGYNKSEIEKLVDYAGITLIVVYLLLISYQFRAIAIEYFISKSRYTKYYEYLNKSKPFYITQEKWQTIRQEYIDKNIKPDFYKASNPESGENYRILNNDKPNLLTNNEWEALKDNACKSLAAQFTYLVNTASHYDKLEKMFVLKKPKHYPETGWNEITEKINKTFVAIQKQRAQEFISISHIQKELKLGAPEGMLLSYWDKYAEFLKGLCYSAIYGDILHRHDPLEYIKEIDLTIFTEKQKKTLKDLSYKINLLELSHISSVFEAELFLKSKKPEWIKDEDFEKLEKTANEYISLQESTRKNILLSTTLSCIAELVPLKDKPELLNDKEWSNLLELEKEITTEAIKVKKDKLTVRSEKQETNALKEKVLKQLSIIDSTLTDPVSINKIEDYDNPFSEGNFSNLKKISDTILKQR